MNLFVGTMTDPFVAGRGEMASQSTGPTGVVATYGQTPKAVAEQVMPRWSTWAAGYGGSQTTDGSSGLGSNRATSSIGAGAAGADYRFSPFTIAGFALAGGGTNFSVSNAGTGRSDLFQAGAFVRQTFGAAYVSAAAAYGWQDITTDRTVAVSGFDQLHAHYNANAYSGRVEGGYRYLPTWTGGFGLTPYGAIQVTAFDLPSYAEHGIAGANTFALAYSSKTATDTGTELGFRADKSFAMSGGVLTLRGRAAWAHDYDPNRGVAATFQTLPGATFVVSGARHASDAALTTASAEFKWVNGWSVAGTFEGEFSPISASYAGKGVVRYTW